MSENFVPVNAEPMHRQRWISDSVRLVCAQIPAHSRCLWHQHVKYGVYIVISPLDCIEQAANSEPKALVSHAGSVFCRDHTLDKLIHVVQTAETPAFIVEVELLHDKDALLPNADLPLHAGDGVELLHNAPECRVYRLSLQQQGKVKLELPTETVVVAVRACSVMVTTSAGSSQRELAPGDDMVLTAGPIEIELVADDGDASDDSSAPLVLAEVY